MPRLNSSRPSLTQSLSDRLAGFGGKEVPDLQQSLLGLGQRFRLLGLLLLKSVHRLNQPEDDEADD